MARSKKVVDLPNDEHEELDLVADQVESSGATGRPADLFEVVANHQRKSDLVCYLYRLWPVIDRRLSGASVKYIDKLTAEATTPDHIRKAWGSGRYRLDLFDCGVGKYGARIASSKLDLGYDLNCMPVIGPGYKELVLGHPDNKSFEQTLRVRGLLIDQEGDDMKEQGAAVAQLTNTVTELAGKLSERKQTATDEPLSLALQLIERLQAGRPDPLEQAARLKEILGSDNKLLAVLLDNQARMTELLLKQAAPASGTPALVDQLDTMTTVFEKLSGLAQRGGRGGNGSGWGELIRVLPAVVGGIAQALSAAAALKAAAPGGAVASAGAVPALPPNSGVPDVNATATKPLIDAETDEVLSVIGISPVRIVELMGRAVSAFKRGISGSAFADGLIAMEDDGERIYQVVSTFGTEQILAMIRKSPAWAELGSREQEVAAWVDDFLAYGSESDEEGPAE